MTAEVAPVRFPALGFRGFRILWTGMLFASGTLAFQYYAQMWLIYSITDSAWLLGVLGGLRGLATLLFGLYGGVLADRMDRRKLLMITGTISLSVTIILGLAVVLGMTNVWLIFLLIFIGSATGSVDAPIRQALIPELVPAQHIPNAVALTTAAQMGSFAITPVIAGLVIDAIGPGGAYLVSSIGNLGILVALAILPYQSTTVRENPESVFDSVRIGVRFSRGHPMILWIILVAFITGALSFSWFLGLIAQWAGDVLAMTPGEYGMLAATWGCGTLAASFALSWIGVINRPGRLFMASSLLFGLSFMVFGLVRALPLVALMYVINGAAWTTANITSTGIVQRIVPNEVRGRVMSLFMLNGAIAQLNSMLLGVIADIIPLEILLPAATGLCTVIVAMLFLSVPTLRSIDRRLDEHFAGQQMTLEQHGD